MSNLLEQASLVLIPSGYKEDVVYSEIPLDGAGDLSFSRASNGTRINSSGLVEVTPWNDLTYSEDFTNAVWTKITATVTANSTTAPNGTNTATKFESTGSGVPQLSRAITGTNTISIYAKAGNISNFRIWIGSEVIFDLSTGTVLAGTATMENVGNGWYRCIISATSAGSVNPYFVSTASGQFVYIWGAQLNIGSTAKPYFPTTDRLNVPRLTYQNGGGGCPSLLLEKQSTNIATYSEDATQWNKGSNVGSITVTANQTISPDGTQNADKVQFPAVGSGSQYAVLFFPFTASATAYTGSVWLKGENGGEVVWINFTKDGVNYTQTLCTLTTSWQRFTLSSTLTSGADNFQIGVDTRDSAESAKPAQTIYVWGRQLEASSYVTTLIPTTSSSATRVADACYKTGISSLIGQSEGTVFLDFVPQGGNITQEVFGVTLTGGGAEFIAMYAETNGNLYFITNIVSSTLISSNAFGQRFKVAYSYKAGTHLLYANGVQISATTFSSVYSLLDALYMNQSATGSGVEKLTTNEMLFSKTAFTATELASLTTI